MERKLDLSRLTDEEAKHVWEVIHRDLNLRKTEEERLGEMKTKIEKEGSKRELLGSQSPLPASLCICCLQPFRLLLPAKRQCSDCSVYTCTSCSRYNKKERGWLCDNCRMTRVMKTSTAGWYHDNMRSRFKRFGSAKVMKSLYKRLNGDGGRDDDTQSMPDVRSHVCNGTEDDHGEADAQRYKAMRKSKRLLSVHPLDFDQEDYLPHSRRASVHQLQAERGFRNDADYDVFNYNQRLDRRRSLDRYAMRPDDYAERRMVRTRSLSKIMAARQQYIDTSDEEDYPRHPPVYHQPPYRRRNSKASSQENLGHAPPMNELNKRMSAIESLLSRLEEKMTAADETVSGQEEEEETLRRKPLAVGKGPAGIRGGPALDPLKDFSSSSDEIPTEAQKRSAAAALCDLTTEALRTINATEDAMAAYGLSAPVDGSHVVAAAEAKQADDAFRELEENVYVAAGQSYELEAKLRRLEQRAKSGLGGTTDSELSELEEVVALTAARVQSAESEVSDIESKIVALNAAGSKKKVSGSHQKKKSTPDTGAEAENTQRVLRGHRLFTNIMKH